jgi:hypothetical protein
MERRRQATLGGALQPLGGNQDRKPPWRSGLGEDLGSTSYKPAKSGRPKIVPNPRVVKAKEEEETQKGNSEGEFSNLLSCSCQRLTKDHHL